MGKADRLLAPVDGKPMVAHAIGRARQHRIV